MKKLKTLCAVVGAAAVFCSGAAFAAEQKFNVPEYDLKNAKKISIMVPGTACLIEKYYVDRNEDGKTDLIEFRLYDFRLCDSRRLEEAECLRELYIDDDFDGYMDRVLIDEEGGRDGFYEEERRF